jgi:8-oxo-dGTP diphosphatase
MPNFAGVILVDHRGHLLLQERDENPAIDPEKWGLVGGHVDPGEDFEPAAYRELAEETEIVARPGSLVFWKEFPVWHEAYASLDRMAVYAAATNLRQADVVCHEGRQIVFVPPDQARHLDLTTAAATIVPEFLDSTLYAQLTAAARMQP